MKIEEIQEQWSKDCEIDNSELSIESIKTPKLHNKYYMIYMNEGLLLKKLELKLKQLKQEKYVFFTQGANEDTPISWKLPPCGKVIKSEANLYVEIDNDVIKLTLFVAEQAAKVAYLEEIIKVINNRSYHINNAINWNKFVNGEN